MSDSGYSADVRFQTTPEAEGEVQSEPRADVKLGNKPERE
jgi:hypothetical protein